MRGSSPEAQIETLVAKYTPEVAAQLRESRIRLRALFPRGFELVFDTYNALVFAISPTEQTSGAFISVAGYPRWVTLFFMQGTQLHDPHGLLEGGGKQVRGIRLKTAACISTPEVQALIEQAVRPHQPSLQAAPVLTTTIKTIAAKQRPRRPVSA